MPDMTGATPADPTGETPSGVSAGHRLTAGLTVGGRVTVRHRLPASDGAAGAAGWATDVVGELVSRDDETLVVTGRSGPVPVRRADVVAAKDVPPPPSRPGPAHQRIGVDDLQRLMDRGWPATDARDLGDWRLRFAGGFTGRANSVLAVGDPRMPVGAAVDAAEAWYAERDAPALFQVVGGRGFDPAATPLGAELVSRGYVVGGGRPDWQRVLVMTALADDIPALTESSAPVVADATLTPEWLMTYGEQRSVVPGVTEAVLTGCDGLFMWVRDPDTHRMVALTMATVQTGWSGVFGLWVHPDHRRRGLARDLTAAVGMLARGKQRPAVYLQVSADNAAARGLYESMGFTVHHEYSYLRRP